MVDRCSDREANWAANYLRSTPGMGFTQGGFNFFFFVAASHGILQFIISHFPCYFYDQKCVRN